MLVLNRGVGERIQVGESIFITIVRIQSDKVRIGIEAPPEVSVHREEIYLKIKSQLLESCPEGSFLVERDSPQVEARLTTELTALK